MPEPALTAPIFTTLISAADLAALMSDPPPAWALFDCRHDLANPAFGEEAFAAGHLPGARFLHLDRDLSGPTNGRNGRHPLPDAATLAAKMGALGVNETTQVVAYDDAGGMFAARLWWLMRWLGHERVALLDGGLQAWCRAGGALEHAVRTVAAQHLPVKPGATWVDAGWVAAHLDAPDTVLVDARSPDRFRGENEMLDPVAGHIPGAVNRFFRDNLNRNGTFKFPGVLHAEFSAILGGHSPGEVVHQCGSGVTACHNLLAMEVAGLPGSRLYPGSWSEWCADPSRPHVTGA
jgi:thiosulfate/3-mercaptopyruvate sulfurtransferase